MHVRRLRLTNFRCYRELDVDLPCGPIVLAGRNAQGKSSLLEALYLLATTRSPHTGAERELLNWDASSEPMPHCRALAEVARQDGGDTVEIVYASQGADDGRTRLQKHVKVNGARKRAIDAIGTLTVVLFSPRDLAVVDGAPSERRRFLDVLLCQLDRDYCRSLSRYNKVLTQRNHLLRSLRERGGERSELGFWDQHLTRHGAVVVARRARAAAALSDLAGDAHASMAGAQAALDVRYVSNLSQHGPEVPANAGTEALEEAFGAVLTARQRSEIARGVTAAGPHRDDLVFKVGGVDMRVYGSRGQQRTVALALRLAEAQLMHRETGEHPVVLLDDVLSELDDRRRSSLLAGIGTEQQTLLTTTTAERLPAPFLDRARVLTVEASEVTETEGGMPPHEDWLERSLDGDST